MCSTQRPAISKPRKLWLVGRLALGKAVVSDTRYSCGPPTVSAVISHAPRPRTSTTASSPCRAERNALSAVYAFMRHADDISDDPSIPPEQRRKTWTNG